MSKKTGSDKLRKWVENVASHSELLGHTRLSSRIILFLIITDPDPQSAKQISEFLDIAKSAISVELRHLLQAGEIVKLRQLDDRTEYYRLHDQYWSLRLAKFHKDAAALYAIMEEGISLFDDNQPHGRIRELKEFFVWQLSQRKLNMEEWLRKTDTPQKSDESK